MDAAEQEQTFDLVPQSTADEVVEIVRDESGRVDSAGAAALARKRWEKYYAAIERGAAKAANGTPAEALEEIARVTTERAMDKSDKKQLQAAQMMMTRLMGEGQPAEAASDGMLTLTAKIPAKAIPDIAAALSKARELRDRHQSPD